MSMLDNDHMNGIKRILLDWAVTSAVGSYPSEKTAGDYLRNVGLTEPVVRWILGERTTLNDYPRPYAMSVGVQQALPPEFIPTMKGTS